MKILHIAQERGAAELAARALHGIAAHITLTWTPTCDAALQWLHQNHDAAAVIVEVDLLNAAAFVDEVREGGSTTPIVIVARDGHLESLAPALNAGADGVVAAGPSLQVTLSRAVVLAINRERARHDLHTRALADAAAERDRVEQALARAEEARSDAEQRNASELAAAAERLAAAQARHTATLARDARICAALQERLFELERAHRSAHERTASEAAAFADQLARRHAEFNASLAQTTHARDAFAAQLSAASAALEDARRAHHADAAAAAELLRQREADLEAARTEADAERRTLEAALARAEAAQQEARARADAALAAAHTRLTALEDLLAQETDKRTELENTLESAHARHQEKHERSLAELTAASARTADVQAQLDAAREEHAALQSAFDHEAAAAADRLARREAELAGQLSAAGTREADLLHRLASESDARAAVDRQLAAERRESARGRQRSARIVAAQRRRNRHDKASLEALLANERTAADGERRAMTEALERIHEQRSSLQSLLETSQEQVRELQATVDQERAAQDRVRLDAEDERQRMTAEHAQLSRSFDGLQIAFQTLEQVAGEHAAERARLEGVVAERDSELNAQAERHRAAERRAEQTFATVRDDLREALDASVAENAALRREIDGLRTTLEHTRRQTEMLRQEAERVPDLQVRLEAIQKERRREFERAPHGVCRCTMAGVITDANHWFVTMLGRRRADDLRNLDFASEVFEYAGDLTWLLEQARAIRKTEVVETTWKTRDGRHLTVRLHALAVTSGSVEIVVEDVTAIRALEERLRQAQRLEAVGRLASEVAVTCSGLLRDVGRGAEDWLTSIPSHDAARRQAERLVIDLTRAGSFLRQLEVYGREQTRALEPVNVRQVLRDLAPVLRQVVGTQIELVLPKAFGSFDVDVDTERLERVLVNVAAYARQRMPEGGQMCIDLANTAVGRRFVATYPNVRPGHHVLITVTEVPGAPVGLRGGIGSDATVIDKPGVDLGALVDLVGTCGGHLWMEAQPAGNMVLKIHLPKRVAAETRTHAVEGPHRGNRLTRWFRSGSTAVGAQA